MCHAKISNGDAPSTRISTPETLTPSVQLKKGQRAVVRVAQDLILYDFTFNGYPLASHHNEYAVRREYGSSPDLKDLYPDQVRKQLLIWQDFEYKSTGGIKKERS